MISDDIDDRASLASEKTRYLEILKSTFLIGGSSAIVLSFSVLRTKALAVWLGPEGVGLIGMYNAIIDIAQATFGLGVAASGVRQVAEAAASQNEESVARTAHSLKRLSLVLGIVGLIMLALLSAPIGNFTFGGNEHSLAIAFLSLAVLFRLVSAGQTAATQGLRQIAVLAKINVLAAVLSTVATIALVYVFRTEGIVPSLIASAAATLAVSFVMSRNLVPTVEASTRRDMWRDISPLIRLGLIFMIGSLLNLVAAYLVRMIVVHEGDVAAAGLYQAAWSLGSLYAGFILQAMGTDFYPRLTASANDDSNCNRLVNDQAYISLLLAGPGVLATLTFSPLVMWLFYSPEFFAAADMLRWICLGMLLRVFCWPLGYVVLAKGRQAIFFWTEVAATIVHVGLAYLLVQKFGVVGAASAFFGLYLWHGVLIYALVRRMTGFRWSPANVRLGTSLFVAAGALFLATAHLPYWQATMIGCGAVLVSGTFTLRSMMRVVPADRLPGLLRPKNKSP